MVRHLATRLDDYSAQQWMSVLTAVLWAPAILILGLGHVGHPHRTGP